MVAVQFNIWGDGSINRSGQIIADAPTYVITHGYQSTAGNAGNNFQPVGWIANIAQAIRNQESDANIVLVDWEAGASSFFYPTAAANTEDVGNQVATFLRTNNVNPEQTNLIGHSLGAHVAGFAGVSYRTSTGNALSSITGLDPAGPSFEGTATNRRLDASDANRVVAIHTSETLGFDDRLGTLDVYVNFNDLFQPGQTSFLGNHRYAHTLYTEFLQGYSFTQSNGSLLNLATLRGASNGQLDNSTKNNRAVVGLTLNGSTGNDNLAGGAATDILTGNSGNDYMTGGAGNDTLYGNDGIDRLYGGQGNDSLWGGTGSDRLLGDSGNDILTGIEISSPTAGLGEIDKLTGGTGSDRFVLGNNQRAFYNDGSTSTSGTGDYALITDFNITEDVVQLFSAKTNYQLGSTPSGLPSGTALFLTGSTNELVAVFQGASGLSLSANYLSQLDECFLPK
ncbi:MAG: hypothetical protein HC772_08720, partial [Leptolyngbyaceae cyanobacterium CRU_2_3]|nr:hypothetical protein [Leptolyngbyaceae cyanobacterium CRU_2_3]